MTLEGMMGDGKALQMGTSHELGQNFATAFDIDYLDDTGAQQLCWTTSWGVSTRMVGGLIMAHGDDAGLLVPPALAPIQVVVILVKEGNGAGELAGSVAAELRATGVRVELDARIDTGFGRRVVDWELKGIPLRIEVGPRDAADGQVTLVRRGQAGKDSLAAGAVVARVPGLLDEVQRSLLVAATERRESRTADVKTLEEAVEASASGFARIAWSAVGEEGEARLAQEAVTVRCLQRPDGSVPDAGDEPDLVATVARSY
jgi:prolyl-tRNA synthetase